MMKELIFAILAIGALMLLDLMIANRVHAMLDDIAPACANATDALCDTDSDCASKFPEMGNGDMK